ncbi:hypothetical protein [Flavobacterium oreochromis]|uniref:Lipoprotein n=1 Tax=Flavobacterium columnare TaxID=996 RepID=A0A246GBP3_9FLAO|nr:hypothetical protein [Flavobacterium oreochromis]OWP77235.1 hypothetical protein BWG23_05610 [Flavobacterium oreochromis]OWP78115.1 hypothetical protein BWK62_05800 [Flavobacterium oreochromis]
MKKSVLSLLTLLTVLGTIVTSCTKTTDDEAIVGIIAPAGTENLSGTITNTTTLDPSKTYYLNGSLIIDNGGILNIPAGTIIKSKKGFSNYILVLQGGKININGTADKPVIMQADIETTESGYWGGLIINGKAKLSDATPTGSTEINSAYTYGGNDDTDNSGTIRYLILNNTGSKSSANIEHNGLTLNGVGNGTIIENVFVKNCADDGVEFFGGTVNVKNILCINTDDDMFDYTQGWRGSLDNAYGIWEKGFVSTEADPRGLEGDGNLDGNAPTCNLQSNNIIKNITIDLKIDPITTNDISKQMMDAFMIRRNAKSIVTNAIVKGSGYIVTLVNMNDKKGSGDATSEITVNLKDLTTPPGKEINGIGILNKNEINTGADKTAFNWTKYAF